MMEKLGQAKTHLELKKMIAEVDTTNSGETVLISCYYHTDAMCMVLMSCDHHVLVTYKCLAF